MGCDIHLHIEVKIDGQWEHYGAPYVSRWYALFAKMAGVRDYANATPISAPKGMPEDVTKLTRIDCEYLGIDGHSHSWLGLDELMQLEDWLKDQRDEWLTHSDTQSINLEHHVLHTYLFGNSFTGPRRFPSEEREPKVQDVRFVFWFDN